MSFGDDLSYLDRFELRLAAKPRPAKLLALPVENLDLVEGLARLVLGNHEPETIGQIGIAGEIHLWMGHGRCAYSTYKTKARDSPGHDQVLQQIEAVLIHFGANAMSRQIPGLRGQLNADVAADLANPHPLSVNRERCQPQPQMIAQADGIARLLQRDVLLASKNIQGANRCVEVFAAKQKSMDGPINTVEVERLVKPPATPDECK